MTLSGGPGWPAYVVGAVSFAARQGRPDFEVAAGPPAGSVRRLSRNHLAMRLAGAVLAVVVVVSEGGCGGGAGHGTAAPPAASPSVAPSVPASPSPSPVPQPSLVDDLVPKPYNQRGYPACGFVAVAQTVAGLKITMMSLIVA